MIKINKDSVLGAILEINDIVSNLENTMASLDETIKKNIPDRIDTEWANELRTSWQSYYNQEVVSVLEEMRLNGLYLRKAVNKALEYSKSQGN